MLGRAVNLYFITKYKNISTRKPKYCRAAMRIKEFILYGLIVTRLGNLRSLAALAASLCTADGGPALLLLIEYQIVNTSTINLESS